MFRYKESQIASISALLALFLHLFGFHLLIYQMLIIMIQFFHLVALCEQQVQAIVVPLACGKVLQEHESVLKGHLLDIVREMKEESSAYVAVKLRETLVLR